MADRSEVLCKYHMSGACRFGATCAFSHDLHVLPNLVCKFYLAGCCSYGDKCRYDHVKPGWAAKQRTGTAAAGGTGRAPTAPAAAAPQQGAAQASPGAPLSGAAAGGSSAGPGPSAATAGAQAGGAASVWWELPDEVVAASTSARDPLLTSAWKAAGRSSSSASGEVTRGTAAAHGSAEGPQQQQQQQPADEPSLVTGLVIIDDDVGLEQEAAAVAAASSATSARQNGSSSSSAWAAHQQQQQQQQQPWQWQEGHEGGQESEEQEGEEEGDYYYGYGYGYEGEGQQQQEEEGEEEGGGGDPADPADLPLCPQHALQGTCAQGEECHLIHGLECETCGKWQLHPYNAEAAEEHREQCRLRHERLEARLRSKHVECGICLEPVTSKASVADRKFGLLACDHAFCVACIRSWRSATDTAANVDTALRTCPVCRTPSHFVTPSPVWPASQEEKAAIVDAYKARLKSLDCRHFDFGEGQCPFGTSCFYRHMYRDGRMEEPVLRRAGNADGGVRILQPVRLSNFLDTPQAQRLLNPRRRR